MATKSTSFFTDCVSGVSPLKEMPDVLQPIENDVHQFFDDLRDSRSISHEKLMDCNTILAELMSDDLLPKESSEQLAQHAKSLQGQLTAIEYFARHPFSEAMEVYLNLVAINKKSVSVHKIPSQPKKTSLSQRLDEGECRIFLKSAQLKIQEIHQLLKPLEVQPPLTMVIPPFEEESEVYSYVAPFQERAERAVWLNKLKDELNEISRGLKRTEGVFDPGLKRLHDQCQQGVVALVKRIALLRSDFARRPKSSREALSTGSKPKDGLFSSSTKQGIFSQKSANLTVS